jgi:hypothetical protein
LDLPCLVQPISPRLVLAAGYRNEVIHQFFGGRYGHLMSESLLSGYRFRSD